MIFLFCIKTNQKLCIFYPWLIFLMKNVLQQVDKTVVFCFTTSGYSIFKYKEDRSFAYILFAV